MFGATILSMLALSSLLPFAVTSVTGDPPGLKASKRAEGPVRISCAERPVVALPGGAVSLSCQLASLNQQNVYLLAQPIFLEGPVSPDIYYLYHYLGGDRFENNLQYNRKSAGRLNRAIQFKSAAYVDLAEIATLKRLSPEHESELHINWQLPSRPALPDSGSWFVRIKLIYLTEAAVSRLIENEGLSADCRRQVLDGVRRSPEITRLTLQAMPSATEPSPRLDDCVELISEAFEHAYSNTFELDLGQGSKPRSKPSHR